MIRNDSRIGNHARIWTLQVRQAMKHYLLAGMIGLTIASTARAEQPARAFEVRPIRDVAYVEGGAADPVKHKLDLFLPRDHRDYPVLFFVHGGAWRSGDKDFFFGVYSALGQLFARHGIGAVVINYRLTPQVMHPEHIKDVAQAFAWTVKNIGKYGGRADQVFVAGHSAGGHLVSLLATDDSYLKALGLDLKSVKGVIPLSGVYRIPPRFMPNVFGTDAEICRKASPITHARPDAPPFLILYAEKDLQSLDQMAEEFCRALKDKKGQAEIQKVPNRTHSTIVGNAIVDTDPVARLMLQFILTHVAGKAGE